jgi:hypothetical protein
MNKPAVIDATLMIRRDGMYWTDHHWMQPSSIDDPLPVTRVVEIRDGSNECPPLMAWVFPDRK